MLDDELDGVEDDDDDNSDEDKGIEVVVTDLIIGVNEVPVD
jgi:hypothetical protein